MQAVFEDSRLKAILDKVEAKVRLSYDDGIAMYRSSDLLALAYFKTYKLPVLVTRASNNYGPYHFPEKLIPLMISNALEDRSLPIYGDGLQIRDWLYVEDHCAAIRASLAMAMNRGGSVS